MEGGGLRRGEEERTEETLAPIIMRPHHDRLCGRFQQQAVPGSITGRAGASLGVALSCRPLAPCAACIPPRLPRLLPAVPDRHTIFHIVPTAPRSHQGLPAAGQSSRGVQTCASVPWPALGLCLRAGSSRYLKFEHASKRVYAPRR